MVLADGVPHHQQLALVVEESSSPAAGRVERMLRSDHASYLDQSRIHDQDHYYADSAFRASLVLSLSLFPRQTQNIPSSWSCHHQSSLAMVVGISSSGRRLPDAACPRSCSSSCSSFFFSLSGFSSPGGRK